MFLILNLFFSSYQVNAAIINNEPIEPQAYRVLLPVKGVCYYVFEVGTSNVGFRADIYYAYVSTTNRLTGYTYNPSDHTVNSSWNLAIYHYDAEGNQINFANYNPTIEYVSEVSNATYCARSFDL